MIHYYSKALMKYFTFSGRARRKEFWTFNSINVFLTAAYVFLSLYYKFTDSKQIIDIAFAILGVLLIMPTISLMVRRLHDTGRSGVVLLINVIPVIGQIVLLIFFMEDSSASYNEYGEYPKFKKNVF